MASIFEQYGINEVADVYFYKIGASGEPTVPEFYSETLKVSTIEQTAESTEARGGKGNPVLRIWDFNKEVNLTLEDALFTPKSLAVMFGDGKISKDVSTIKQTVPFSGTKAPTTFNGPQGKVYDIPSGATIYDELGQEVEAAALKAGIKYFYDFEMPAKDVGQIVISANTFPGVYYITGNTYVRDDNGEDKFFQFIIPKGKIVSENTITLEAGGDPSTFSMNVRVLRPESGDMVKLIQYDLDEAAQG